MSRRAPDPRRPMAVAGLVAGCVGLLAASPALANGRYPLANQLVADPVDSTQLLARTTFGLVRSADGGTSWTWVCEDALGMLETAEDPALAMTADGSTLVAFSHGISVSHDGCSFAAAAGIPDGRFAVDLTVSPARPHAALAIQLAIEGATYALHLVASGDDGATWTEVGDPIADFLGATVEVAPSDARRIYVSGKVLASQQVVLARSDDGGLTFVQMVIDGVSADAGAFIGAVDPVDPDVVYLRVSPTASASGRVLVSRDAGLTFDQLVAIPGDVSAFALSPDGLLLAIGGGDSGLYLGSSAAGPFALVGTVKPSCLTWIGSRLFVCAREATDRFSIGVSDDAGADFTSLLRLADIVPGTCPAGSSAGICATRWSSIAASIGADAGNAGPDARAEPAASGGGCACAAAGSRAGGGGGAYLEHAALPIAGLAIASLLITRRRRQRPRPRRPAPVTVRYTDSPCR